MHSHPELLLSVGIIFFIGLASDIAAKKIRIPRVTLLIIMGILLGPGVTDFLPHLFITEWFHIITTIALGMIGFLIGQQFTLTALKNSGKVVFAIALGKVLLSFILITLALYLLGLPFAAAVILASIASATAPAAVLEVVNELKINNQFVTTLLRVVALDDILAMLLFSLTLAFTTVNGDASWMTITQDGLVEILGSLLLGYLLGYPVAKITGRIKKGEPMMVEALGSVFLISGMAQWFELSPLLATMAMGSAVTTFATHHTRAFHAIENIKWLFMILFFLLAGASLEVDALLGIGAIGTAYIFFRIVGFYIGARLGARLSSSEPHIERWIGIALIPQAGVAIGMALIASQRHPEFSHLILPIILGTTVIFEIIGPVVTRFALIKSLHKGMVPHQPRTTTLTTCPKESDSQ